jgi:hypothetical protein
MPAELAGVAEQELPTGAAAGDRAARIAGHRPRWAETAVGTKCHIPRQAFPVVASQLPPARHFHPLHRQSPLQRRRRLGEHHQHQVQTRISDQLSLPGPLPPTSPTSAARATAHSTYSVGKLARDCADTECPQPGEREPEVDTRLRLRRPAAGPRPPTGVTRR